MFRTIENMSNYEKWHGGDECLRVGLKSIFCVCCDYREADFFYAQEGILDMFIVSRLLSEYCFSSRITLTIN